MSEGAKDKRLGLRLSERDLEAVQVIVQEVPISSESEAVRYAIHQIAKQLRQQHDVQPAAR